MREIVVEIVVEIVISSLLHLRRVALREEGDHQVAASERHGRAHEPTDGEHKRRSDAPLRDEP